jgi:hypothetical protein
MLFDKILKIKHTVSIVCSYIENEEEKRIINNTYEVKTKNILKSITQSLNS